MAADGLLAPGGRVLVLVSGGQDSTCLLDVALAVAGREAVMALHVNYGLRPAADADAALCRELCAALGVELAVRAPAGAPSGNMQAWARGERYAAAGELAAAHEADVAAGHTASDQVETVLYRLAASPGRRALLGMRSRSGSLIRPLLGVSRRETEAYCRERGLPFTTDAGNASPVFARNRVRHRLVPALRQIHPAAESNVLRTVEQLRDEAEVLDAAVGQARATLGERPAVRDLAALRPALARLILQDMADELAGPGAPAVGRRLEEVLSLASHGGTATLDLGTGLLAEVRYGHVSVQRRGEPPDAGPDPGWLEVPGALSFDGGRLSAVRGSFPVGDGSVDPARLAERLEVRAWAPGDTMRPLGLGGTKSLQDLFTDAKVPRDRRRRLPVVISGGEIAWVPGVATGESFRVADTGAEHVRLFWAAPDYD